MLHFGKILFMLSLMQCCFLSSNLISAVSANWTHDVATISREYGVEVEFDDITFPPYWASWNPKWEIISIEDRSNVLQKLRIDLAHYEPAFLLKHLKKIFLYKNLTFRGQIYGGTNDHKYMWLYLNMAWVGDRGQYAQAMGFHHEFSSILFKLYPNRFPEKQWRDVNSPSFKYKFDESLETNLTSGQTDLIGNTALYEQGFLCSYGQLTLEDDLNTFAQCLIAKPGLMKSRIATSSKIEKKASLLMDFHADIGFNVKKL